QAPPDVAPGDVGPRGYKDENDQDCVFVDGAYPVAVVHRWGAWRTRRHDDRVDFRDHHERERVFLLGQDCAHVQWSAADQPRTRATPLYSDGTSSGEGESARAEALHDSAARAKRLCNGSEPTSRIRGRNARPDAI